MDDAQTSNYSRGDYLPRTEASAYTAGGERSRSAASTRFARLMAVFAFLMLLLLGPTVVERFQYAYTFGRERARVQAATEGLGELNLSALGEASRLVAQVAGPSVVNIRTVALVGSTTAADEWSYLVPRRRTAQGQGSGVIVDEQGYIVTNSHVVAGAEQISVQLSDGRTVPANLVGADVLTDIAVLKIEADNLLPAKWGDSDEVEVGDLVWAVGSPYGLERSVTFGIISAKGRRGVTQSSYQDFLQTDAAVNPGNSGGPLVNIHGHVVGINTAIVGPAYQGISFAIPSAIALDVYDRLKAHGRVARGWLGVELREMTPELRDQIGLEGGEGVAIANVLQNSPAAEAGVKRGDVIIQWNGHPTPDPITLSRLVAATEIGAEAKLTVVRDKQPLDLTVKVSERPE